MLNPIIRNVQETLLGRTTFNPKSLVNSSGSLTTIRIMAVEQQPIAMYKYRIKTELNRSVLGDYCISNA